MKNYDQFHDGRLDGLLIQERFVQVFLSTESKEPFVLAATGVVVLTANGFKTGNIIFEVLTKQSTEIMLQDIVDVYELSAVDTSSDQGEELLRKAQVKQLILLEINPSYGANCLILAETVELLGRDGVLNSSLASATR